MRVIIFTLLFSTMCITSIFAQDNHCLNFNGIDNAVSVTGFGISGDFTISTWFRCNAVSNSPFEERIISFGPTDRLEIGIEDFTNRLWVYDQNSGSTASFGEDLRDGQWHQVTYVKSGTERFIYLDGFEFNDYQISSSDSYGDNFRIGAWTGGSSTHTFFNGQVDETKIWSVAKTADEISEVIFCPLTGDEDNLLAYYDYNQGNPGGANPTETILMDRTSNNRDGTLSNFNLIGSTSNWVASDNVAPYYLEATISQNGSELTAESSATSYQWLDCNDNLSEIAGATSANFTPDASGSYAVLTSNFACSEISDCFDFINVSAKDVLKETDVLVYPNPVTDFVLVDIKVKKETEIVVTNQLGKVVLIKKTAPGITKIDLGDLVNGLYFLSVDSIVRKVVKI